MTTPTNFIAITPSEFERHLIVLKQQGYTGVTARDVAAFVTSGTPLPPKPVLLTFDDGWVNQWDHAVPLLRKHGFTATFFVYPKVLDHRQFMSTAQIAQLTAWGFDIEAHTWGHDPVVRRSGESTEANLARVSKQSNLANEWIARVTGQPPVAIAYPYGYYDDGTAAAISSIGYAIGLTVDEGVEAPDEQDRYLLKRWTVMRADPSEAFEQRLLSRPLALTSLQPAQGARVPRGDALEVSAVLIGGTEPPAGLAYTFDLKPTPSSPATPAAGQAVVAIVPAAKGFHLITLSGRDPDGRLAVASWGVVVDD